MNRSLCPLLLGAALVLGADAARAQITTPVPPENRGRIDAERSGIHDANQIRTVFYNFGMVGDYPPDPLRVDLSVFHSVEVPKGTGRNYSDGITPFVLAKVRQENGSDTYIMETGFRERQGRAPGTERVMRFEPRPGYFQNDPTINQGRSVALSNDPRTWPDAWPDRLGDPTDPGWSGSWDGYFGKRPAADQESYVVYDDNLYSAFDFYPDSRDRTRRGLGLRVEQRGFQWSNPQAGNVIFWHYDITNEGTTDYNDNIVFGLYMDSGVGGSEIGPDGVPESDDDNAFFDKSSGLNLVYTWDKSGRGTRGPTGYLGYAYLETPGNGTNGKDDDDDGITDERRDDTSPTRADGQPGSIGQLIVGQPAIRAWVESRYTLAKFEAHYGALANRPAFKAGRWFTADEDLDWTAEFSDTGSDGVFGTRDTGEGDGVPTYGEPNVDRTDVDESDQIGLTGFKYNRIKAGVGSPSQAAEDLVFFDDGRKWPERLYRRFTTPDSSFDAPLVQNYNIAFLFASGPFRLRAGQTERFSLALAYGNTLGELRTTTKTVQQIYAANYQFAVPPPLPTVQALTGDGRVTLTWDDKAERAFDPVTNTNDFEGYRIYRATDPTFLDAQRISNGRGTGTIGNGRPLAQFDLANGITGFSRTIVEGVGYFLGDDTGLRHTFTDTTAVNGQTYYYAVTAYDRGSDSLELYPSENAITVSRTLRGGTILPTNAVEVRPNPPALGYTPGAATTPTRTAGNGAGTVDLRVVDPTRVPDGHTFRLEFFSPPDSVRATGYRLIDATVGDTVIFNGTDLAGAGTGVVGAGIQPIIRVAPGVTLDSAATGFVAGSPTNLRLRAEYRTGLPANLRRPGYPVPLDIQFGNAPLDTSVAAIGQPSRPIRFRVVAKEPTGDLHLKVRIRDLNGDGNLSAPGEYADILTAVPGGTLQNTWRLTVDTTGLGKTTLVPPGASDRYTLALRVPLGRDDRFTFTTTGQRVDEASARQAFTKTPYVVPNPYVGAASFEPGRFAVSGRGERRIEFRDVPVGCTIRIYTVAGALVQTLHQSGNPTEGFVPWDLRTADNLDAAPGLYLFQVDAGALGTRTGKFALIK